MAFFKKKLKNKESVKVFIFIFLLFFFGKKKAFSTIMAPKKKPKISQNILLK